MNIRQSFDIGTRISKTAVYSCPLRLHLIEYPHIHSVILPTNTPSVIKIIKDLKINNKSINFFKLKFSNINN